MESTENSETISDRRADKRSALFIVVLLLGSFIVLATSLQLESLQRGKTVALLEPWLREAGSHIWIIILLPLFPILINRFPISFENWRHYLPHYLLAFVVLSAIHILGMVGFRKLTYPALLGYQYNFGLGDPVNWLYEFRKDFLTFTLITLGFLTGRAAMQNRLERSAARADALNEQRIVLKSGGRTMYICANDVIWAKAASNYVEISTDSKTHLARMTLTALETLLGAADTDHVRIHRSALISQSRIAEIIPTGQGDATVILTTGDNFKCSRHYRPNLEMITP